MSSGYEEIVVHHGSVSAELWDKLVPLGVYHNGEKGSQLTIWVHRNVEINMDPLKRTRICWVCGQVLSEVAPRVWRCEDCDRARP